METLLFPRDGRRPLKITGTLLARSQGQDYGREPIRWYDLAAYETETQRYVLTIHYETRWQGETPHDAAEEAASLEWLVDYLEAFNPCTWLIGYKPLMSRSEGAGEHYAARQAHQETDLRTRFAAQVRDLCMALGVAEEAH